MPRRARTIRPLVAIVVALITALSPAVAVASRNARPPHAASRTADLPLDTDVCVLLTEDDLIRATGAVAVRAERPGSQGGLPLGCAWELDPGQTGAGEWTFTVGLQAEGGRQRFEQEAAFYGGEPIAGLGDDAYIGISSDAIAHKGDTMILTQYLAFGGEGRPGSVVLRSLTWLLLERLDTDGVVPGDVETAVERLRAREFGTDTVDAFIRALARSGIATYPDDDQVMPIVPPSEPLTPITLLYSQARAMALEAWAGGGLAGEDLDGLSTTPEGLAPHSWLLAGYTAAVETDGARLARALLGPQDWSNAPAIVFPQLVILLFAADVLRDQGEATAGTGGRGRLTAVGAQLLAGPRTAQADVCSRVSKFVEDAMVAVFEGLRLNSPGSGIGKVPVAIWNFVVSVAEFAVRGIIRAFDEAVVSWIAQAAAIGVLAVSLVSVLRPWTMTVAATPGGQEKGVGSQQPTTGVIQVRVNLGGLTEWPRPLSDCYRTLLGKELPKLNPEGDPIYLTVRQTPGDLMVLQSPSVKLDARGQRDLPFTALVDAVPEPWERLAGSVTVTVRVERRGLGDLATLASRMLLDRLPPRVRGIVGPLVGPSLRDLAARLDTLISQQQSNTFTVAYHVPKPTPNPDATPGPGDTPSPSGAVWVHYERPAEGDAVNELTILEFVACDGPSGTWRGVLRTGDVTSEDGFEIPMTEFPVEFRVPLGGSVVVTTGNVVDMATPFPDVPVGYAARIAIFGRRMSVNGLPVAQFTAARMASLPIEPAPAGMCPA